jgi:hypothetical protein
VASPDGFEPSASRLGGARSIQLSYGDSNVFSGSSLPAVASPIESRRDDRPTPIPAAQAPLLEHSPEVDVKLLIALVALECSHGPVRAVHEPSKFRNVRADLTIPGPVMTTTAARCHHRHEKFCATLAGTCTVFVRCIRT